MTTAQKLYRTILDGKYGRDVEFIANVILTSATSPTTKLRNLIAKLQRGHDVRCGNEIDQIRVNGNVVSLRSLDYSESR